MNAIRRSRPIAGLVAGMLLSGCATDAGSGPGENPGFTITISPGSISIEQGKQGTIVITVVSEGGFAGPVAILAQNAPQGVTVGQATVNGGSGQATLRVEAAATATPGSYVVTIRASSPGMPDATATFSAVVTAAPTGGFTFTLDPASVSVVQGEATTSTVRVSRQAPFAGVVGLVISGAPTGLTVTPRTPGVAGDQGILDIVAAAALAAGSYSVTVTGNGNNVPSRTATLTVQVTDAATGGFTLALNPGALTIVQGQNGNTAVNVARQAPFAGTVNLTLAGAPAGVTGAFNPAAVTGAASTLTISVGAAVAPGTYNLTVNGTGTGVANQSVGLTLTVNQGGGGGGAGNAAVDFSQCAATDRPLWFAYQDGNGAWTAVTPTANVYRFTINGARGGIAWATADGTTTEVIVQLWSRTELTSATLTPCGAGVAVKSVNGTVAGLGAMDFAQISLGGGFGQAFAAAPNFTINSVQNGTHDLVGWRRDITGGASPDRGFIRRDQNIAAGGSVGVVDFGGGESFAPATATLTYQGTVGGELYFDGMSYMTGAACMVSALYTRLPTAATTATARGFPAAMQRPTDFHYLTVSGFSGTTNQVSRTVLEAFRVLANRTITMPALVVPTVTSLGGPYKRLQAAVNLAAEYQLGTNLQYSNQANDRFVIISASFGWLGGASVTLSMPDFSGVGGWNNSWAPASGSNGTWSFSAVGSNLTTTLCQEGLRTVIGASTGSH